MANDVNSNGTPGPNKNSKTEVSGVDKLLSRFGPVEENSTPQSPGPRPEAGSVKRPTNLGRTSQSSSSQSSRSGTATIDLDHDDEISVESADGAGSWTDPSQPPTHLVPVAVEAPSKPLEVIDRRDWVRVPRRTGPVFRGLVLGFVALLAVAGVYNRVDGWLANQYDPPGEPGELVEFEIASGASANEVTQQLFADDVIANPTLFRYWIADNLDGDFQAGQYNCLQENMSFEEARDCLIGEGPVPPTFFSITIPEGLRLVEMLEVLNDANPQFDFATLQAELSATIVNIDDLSGVPGAPIDGNPDPTGSGKEGFLFPATYQIDERDQGNARAILSRMADQMEIEFANAEANVGRAPIVNELELTDYEILTLASLIEEEARTDADRARISRVIYNRLAQGSFALGIDATSCYAANKPCADLTQEDLDSDSPWNTRNLSNFGLPPTPIASPGAASIEAALNPEPGDWTFYVLTELDGSHTFATNQAEFDAAVAVCRERDLGC